MSSFRRCWIVGCLLEEGGCCGDVSLALSFGTYRKKETVGFFRRSLLLSIPFDFWCNTMSLGGAQITKKIFGNYSLLMIMDNCEALLH